jgi:hypothetical protein
MSRYRVVEYIGEFRVYDNSTHKTVPFTFEHMELLTKILNVISEKKALVKKTDIPPVLLTLTDEELEKSAEEASKRFKERLKNET